MSERQIQAQAARSRSQALTSANGTGDILCVHVLKILLTEDDYRSSAVWTKEVARFMAFICARTNMKSISEDDLRQQVFDALSTKQMVVASLSASTLEPFVPSWVKTTRDYEQLAGSLEVATSKMPALLASICVHGRDKGSDSMDFFLEELDASRIRKLLPT